MRIGSTLDRIGLARLFGEYLDAQHKAPAVAPQPVRLQFKFLDSFETSNNGAQQWLVRREVADAASSGSPVRGAAQRAGRAEAGERISRTLFADGFEPARALPVDLGQTRSTVNRFQPRASRTQAAAQDDGFMASVGDL